MGGDLRSKYNPTLPNIGSYAIKIAGTREKYLICGAALEPLGAAGDKI